ncbi:activity-dependent neuroprotective protein 2a isoform X2 [Lepisosteus oculatus]|nr:PREDICTED: ADNP homeobox protein 2 isoform X2 [Lepisosteus oculatus]XP_015213201.1 PREDICTED: ADNP homeobox protein 2 isoform X2 [Lepisosteus oculatus]XP_015213202.1 PREDICTED: ADNP homeobox protein 2 isoform X2 [Lepisosteus oculatus]XP_015213203.1 PREDICTED: ADNP homeobox protein 2 isoform X2 [Lepisosteus oculatus]
MFQLPVVNLEKIRKSRKRVKNILLDIGLQDCKDLLGELQSFDAGDKYFHNTEWWDLSEGDYNGKRKKKPKYRTNLFCCSLCKFSSRTHYAYRGHVQRCHEDEQDLEALATCPVCPFTAHPKVINQHCKIFHTVPRKNQAAPSQTGSGSAVITDRFSCRKCPYQDSLYYCMKKHILVNHYTSLLNRYFGQRTESEMNASSPPLRFYCRMCNLPADSSEHLLYHILTSDKHKELEGHLKFLMFEHGKIGKRNQHNKLQSIAPKAKMNQPVKIPKVLGTNEQQPAKMPQFPQNVRHSPEGTLMTGAPVVPAASPLRGPAGAANSTGTLVCAPGTAHTYLPPPASALVQLASAEAKGLLPPGSAVATLQNSQPPPRGVTASMPPPASVATSAAQAAGAVLRKGPAGTSLPSAPESASKQMSISVGVPVQQQQRLTLLPPGLPVNVPNKMGVRGPGSQPLLVTQRLPLNQTVSGVGSSKGTMLASQSVLSQLIPTGNKVNGLPTYTLAPVQVTMPVQSGGTQTLNTGPLTGAQGSATLQPNKPPAQPVLSSAAASKQAKKWITCPVCNELFPSNVYQVHTEVAHKQAGAKLRHAAQGLAARAPFLKKVKEKTMKCLLCKILLSEKGLFEHLLHGLNCLYCPAMFYSLKQLMEHTNVEHGLSQKANCDFMKNEYQILTDYSGGLLFPYFDFSTCAPKELLGDRELNLVLVTGSRDLIYVKMVPGSTQTICQVPVKTHSTNCPFCPEKLHSAEDYELHLKVKHHIMPTIHAILKTPAFKCIYCCGVYTGKTTPKAISIHVQRCRCAPKTAKDLERLMSPGSSAQRVITMNGGLQRVVLYSMEPGGPQVASSSQESNPQLQSKLRLEKALKEAVEANKREREALAAKRRKVDTENVAKPPAQNEPSMPLVLDPTGMEMRSFEDRKQFLTKYFNRKPYLSKKETEVLAARMWFNKTDVACHFGSRRSRCMKAIQKNRAAVLLGFNMAEVMKLKHDLFIPETDTE